MPKQIVNIINTCKECYWCSDVSVPEICDNTTLAVCSHINAVKLQGLETIKRIIPHNSYYVPNAIPNWCPLDDYVE